MLFQLGVGDQGKDAIGSRRFVKGGFVQRPLDAISNLLCKGLIDFFLSAGFVVFLFGAAVNENDPKAILGSFGLIGSIDVERTFFA